MTDIELDMRLDVIEFMLARITAEGFESREQMQAWMRAMDDERLASTQSWRAQYDNADPIEQERCELVMAAHQRAWDRMLVPVRRHYDKLHPDA